MKEKLLVLFLIILLSQNVFGQGSSIGITVGVGASILEKKELYGNIQTDFYPEIGGFLNFSGVELGINAGLVYRKFDDSYYTYTYYYGYNYYKVTYKIIFIPINGYVKIRPLDFVIPDIQIAPYIGAGLGAFVGAGDDFSKKSYLNILGFAGIEYKVIRNLDIYIEAKYCYSKLTNTNYNLGGIFMTAGGQVKLPF
jgi:hypothetical protein